MDKGFFESRAKRYQFLSTLYRDEIPLNFIASMQNEQFLEGLLASVQGCGFMDLTSGAEGLVSCLRKADPEELYKELSYDYADIFLNAGANPAFPYESAHTGKKPVLMQKPVFALREYFKKAGVHKNPGYKDLDDHIAVEMEFLRYLLEKQDEDLYRKFFKGTYLKWVNSFCDQLTASANTVFYQALAHFTRGALMCENMRIDGFTRGEETTRKMMHACEVLDLDSDYFTLKEGGVDEEPLKEIPSHCYTCGALCGMTAKLKDGILTGVSGLNGDPKGGGRLCPKGAASPNHLYSPYRLKAPLIKENGRFRKASWDEALDAVAKGIKSIEPAKLGFFRGNDFINWIHEGLFDHLGCPKMTHRPMCDNANRMANEHNLNDKRPWINYEKSDYIIHFGMNEFATSYGQHKTTQLKAALKNGAKLVVFDPRRSETAAAATEWIPVKPATDGAVALAMCHVIIKNELYDKDFVKNWTHGFDELKKRVLGDEDGTARTPEWAAEISGVPADTIERIALEFAQAENKGALSWTGLAQVPNGMYGTAALQALNGLCGTFDAPGGPSLPFKRKLNSPWGKDQEKPPKGSAPKLHKLNMWSGWVPASTLAAVEAGDLKGMILYYGDPALSCGNQKDSIKAIEKMEFKAAIEAYMCNSAILCDVVLPDATWLEQSQIKSDWLYDAFIAYYAKIVEPMYDTMPVWKITKELAKRLNLGKYFPWNNIEDAFRNQLEGTPWSFDELKAKGFIITDKAEYFKYKKWGSINPSEGYGSSGKSKTGKYNFVNPVAKEKGVDPLPDYKEPDKELQADTRYPFIFGNFRLFVHEHSSTFSNFQIMKMEGTNPLWINKIDARKLAISEGDKVRLQSPWGSVEMVASPTWSIMQGVLGSPGGFGHVRGVEGDPKFPELGGVNSPGIMKSDAAEQDGGTTLLKYIKTKVEKL
ncbi:MAG: molybdopterin-dependent oxidoreductase [Thermodesulfobacteriota bacterium]|nr:molybdopterin-dependent oxidoreductase [Thermodesulfobacteriota bacterium]